MSMNSETTLAALKLEEERLIRHEQMIQHHQARLLELKICNQELSDRNTVLQATLQQIREGSIMGDEAENLLDSIKTELQTLSQIREQLTAERDRLQRDWQALNSEYLTC